MREIVELRLGLEGLDYMRACLSIGKTLSRAVLDTLDLTSGSVTTFLPAGVPEEEIVRFSSGGKLDDDMVYTERESQLMRFGHVHTTDSTFVSLIHTYLKSDPAAFCVLEDETKYSLAHTIAKASCGGRGPRRSSTLCRH